MLLLLSWALLYRPLLPYVLSLPLTAQVNQGLGGIALLLAGWLVWERRSTLLAIPCQPDGKGLWLFMAGGLLALAAHRVEGHFLLAISLALVAAGTLWWLQGKRWVVELWFPLLLLIAIVPLPLEVVSPVLFRLQSVVARLSTLLMHLMGIPVKRWGMILMVGDQGVQVSDTCSGWHMFSAAFWLFLTLIYWQRLYRWRFWVMGIPLLLGATVIANVLRVITLVWGKVLGQDWLSQPPWHELLGLLYFLPVVVGLGRLFLVSEPRPSPGALPSPLERQFNKDMRRLGALVAGSWGLVSLLLILGGRTAAARVPSSLPALPCKVGDWEYLRHTRTGSIEAGNWFAEALYRHPSGETAQVFCQVLLQRGYHPHRFLGQWLGQGYEAEEGKTLSMFTGRRWVPVKVARMARGHEGNWVAVAYLHPRKAVASNVHARLWRMGEHLIWGRSQPWVMVAVAALELREVLALEEAFLILAERWLQEQSAPKSWLGGTG